MTKIIRLTESDLVSLVKKAIKEQPDLGFSNFVVNDVRKKNPMFLMLLFWALDWQD